MSIKRYIATKDNTITNAFETDLATRGTGSNMGASDVLEVFSIYGQATSGSVELSRGLLRFPISTISSDRTAGTIPASGSVRFFLRMYNAKHAYTLPRNFDLKIHAVSSSWEEGIGLDMETYTDLTYDGSGSNWINAGSSSAWALVGGDYHSASYSPGTMDGPFPQYTANFESGTEDLELDITAMVEEWVAETTLSHTNYGLGIQLVGSQEGYVPDRVANALVQNVTGSQRSYYTKKFFARSSEFFYKRPAIEARWDSSKKDDRGNFYYSSSLATAEDNLNTLYLYNYVRGRLRNIPGAGTGKVYVTLYSGSTSPTGAALMFKGGGGVVANNDLNVTGVYVSTGIYSASFAITSNVESPLETLFDVWHAADGDGAAGHTGYTQYHTGAISPKTLAASSYNPSQKYVNTITNLRAEYANDETARFRLFVREKDWNPTIYKKATTTLQNTIIDSASYKITRVVDNLKVVNYGTASRTLHTQLSFDVTGNYFDLDMSLLEPGYSYAVSLAFYNGAIGSWVEQSETFKFRVE